MNLQENLTIGTCAYGMEGCVVLMLKSLINVYRGEDHEKFNLLILDNSPDDEVTKALLKFDISCMRNPNGIHSKGVDILIDHCPTKYMLLVDTDILFLAKVEGLIGPIMEKGAALAGEFCADRAGYKLHPRIHPWFCVIDVEKIKANNIKFHCEKRSQENGSEHFYKHVPINRNIYNAVPMWDVGSSFYHDIKKAGLGIMEIMNIYSFHAHFEGMSWNIKSGIDSIVKRGEEMLKTYSAATMVLQNVKIKDKFICRNK